MKTKIPDPLEFPLGVYCGNDPINMLDTSGEAPTRLKTALNWLAATIAPVVNPLAGPYIALAPQPFDRAVQVQLTNLNGITDLAVGAMNSVQDPVPYAADMVPMLFVISPGGEFEKLALNRVGIDVSKVNADAVPNWLKTGAYISPSKAAWAKGLYDPTEPEWGYELNKFAAQMVFFEVLGAATAPARPSPTMGGQPLKLVGLTPADLTSTGGGPLLGGSEISSFGGQQAPALRSVSIGNGGLELPVLRQPAALIDPQLDTNLLIKLSQGDPGVVAYAQTNRAAGLSYNFFSRFEYLVRGNLTRADLGLLEQQYGIRLIREVPLPEIQNTAIRLRAAFTDGRALGYWDSQIAATAYLRGERLATGDLQFYKRALDLGLKVEFVGTGNAAAKATAYAPKPVSVR